MARVLRRSTFGKTLCEVHKLASRH